MDNTRYQVVIERVPEDYRSIQMLKEVRSWSGLGLRKAKELCDYARSNSPCVLVAGVKQETAEALRRGLNRAGVKAVVRESELLHPMLVYPQADDRYEEHWFFGLRRQNHDG